MSGDATNGLRCLHDAQARFQANGDRDGLLQCLDSEAKYFDQAGKSDEVLRVGRKIHELEAQQSRLDIVHNAH